MRRSGNNIPLKELNNIADGLDEWFHANIITYMSGTIDAEHAENKFKETQKLNDLIYRLENVCKNL